MEWVKLKSGEDVIVCSQSDIDRALKAFNRKIEEEKLQFSCIHAISRGGLVPGVYLSHLLELPFYVLEPPLRAIKPIKTNHCSGVALVVDDIADTGKTLMPLECARDDFFIFTVFYHKQSKIVPDFWHYEKTNYWIVFPWELPPLKEKGLL